MSPGGAGDSGNEHCERIFIQVIECQGGNCKLDVDVMLMEVTTLVITEIFSQKQQTLTKHKNDSYHSSLQFTCASWFSSPEPIPLTCDGFPTTVIAAVGHLGSWIVGSIVFGSSGEWDTSWFWTNA